MTSFAGKVVIITGASSGIGAYAAVKFDKLSAKVVITGRNRNNLAKVAAEIGKNGTKPLTVVADLTKDDEVKKIITETVAAFGRIDVLVNNAGAGLPAKIEDGTEVFDSQINTNLRSVYLLTGLAIPHLAKTKGSVVNISSVAALRPVRGFAPYNIAKVGLDMFTRCAALEFAEYGVRVNSVNPGVTNTNFLGAMGIDSEKSASLLEKGRLIAPLKQYAESEDIVNMIVYLAGPEARCITGSIMLIDNGHMLVSPTIVE